MGRWGVLVGGCHSCHCRASLQKGWVRAEPRRRLIGLPSAEITSWRFIRSIAPSRERSAAAHYFSMTVDSAYEIGDSRAEVVLTRA